ncbi:MAG: hypothetical protein ACU0B1_10510 [Thermohalobaculum sp.]
MSGAGDETPEDMAALRQRNVELEGVLAETRAAGDARLMAAELRAEALRAGIVDLDGLRLLDRPEVSVSADGQVHGADRAVARLRRDKPYLFRDASSSAAAAAPEGRSAGGRMATEMSLDEWRRARADLLRRR